jgi:hypothetical protein
MIDQHAATELRLYIVNDGRLYEAHTVPIRKSLAAKKARNVYKHDLAVKQFGYLVEAGAKKYAKEFGGEWHKLFSAPTRKAVAEDLTRAFEVEFALGNYNDLLPTKYQKPKTSVASQSRHARKKGASSSRRSAEPSTISSQDMREFRGFLRNVTDRQVQGIYEKEQQAGRDAYAELALAEAERRGIELDRDRDRAGSRYAHAHKKSPAQLDREVSHALARRR